MSRASRPPKPGKAGTSVKSPAGGMPPPAPPGGSLPPRRVAAGLALLVAGLAIGYVLGASLQGLAGFDPRDDDPPDIRRGASGLVNPLLECREGWRPSRALAPFRKDIDALIADRLRQGEILRASVYFRDLDNGPWFEAGDRRPYRIGSLLKLPLLIGYLRRAESAPGILEREILCEGGADAGEIQNIVPEHPLEPGKTYTVWELLEHAIAYSDNEAAALLAAADGAESMEAIRRLADFPPFQDGTLWLTPHHFTALFRILYNASFLSVESSQRALELLARVEFRDGLIAGVPEGVQVANKFGERIDGDVAMLHDCGIIYHPGRPYLLCVMTEGRRLDRLAPFIADVSRTAYDAVSRQLATSEPGVHAAR